MSCLDSVDGGPLYSSQDNCGVSRCIYGCKSVYCDCRTRKTASRSCLYLVCCIVLLYILITIYMLKTNGQNPILLGHVGFVLAVHYSDQLTAGAANVYSLQCWAATLNSEHHVLAVVEPFVRDGSNLGINLGKEISSKFYGGTPNNISTLNPAGDNTLRLSDIFDQTMWNARASYYRYSPIVSWKTFMENSPKNLILVDHICNSEKCMECSGTLFKSKQFLESATQFAQRHNFVIVRKVCYSSSQLMTNKGFIELLYGKYKIHESVVLFNHWGGIQRDLSIYRIPISNLKGCIRRSTLFYELRNSERVVSDSQKYIDKFMPEVRNGNKYIGVMLRVEQFLVRKHLTNKPIKEQLAHVMKCLDRLLTEIELAKNKMKTISVFLAMDCGAKGTLTYRSRTGVSQMIDLICQTLYSKLYGNHSNLAEWERSFDSISSSPVPGYIAMLQKNIAAKADCLLFAGGGTFQESTEKLYNYYHPRSWSKCVNWVDQCHS